MRCPSLAELGLTASHLKSRWQRRLGPGFLRARADTGVTTAGPTGLCKKPSKTLLGRGLILGDELASFWFCFAGGKQILKLEVCVKAEKEKPRQRKRQSWHREMQN